MILAAIFVLFLFSLIIYSLNRIFSRAGYAWFLAIGAALLSWLLVLFSLPQEEIIYPILNWSRGLLLYASPTLLLDRFSWVFSVAISTLLLSVLLTDIVRIEEVEPSSWSLSLALTAFGLLSILSANLLTLAMSWMVLDVIDILFRFQQASDDPHPELMVIPFSARLLGSFMLIPAMINTRGLTSNLDFSNIPASVLGYLILAAGLRLGVLPPQSPFLKETATRRGLGTQIRLVPVASSLVLLTRVAVVGPSPGWTLPLVIAASLAVLYGSLSWAWASNELDGRPLWILSLSAFAIVAVVRQNPLASQAWGLGLIFSGSLLFLFSARDRRLLWLPFLGILGISALPFTPSWFGLEIFSEGNIVFGLIFLLGLSALVLGYLRHVMRPEDQEEQLEKWVWVVYPVGLAILPVTHFWVIWVLGGIAIPEGGIMAVRWLLGFVAAFLMGLVIYFNRIGYAWSPEIRKGFNSAVSIVWLYQTLWWIYQTISLFFNYLYSLLEAKGGVLWTILVIVLMVTFFVSRMMGS